MRLLQLPRCYQGILTNIPKQMLCGYEERVHWHEGDSSVCLAYRNENVKVEACLFGSSNLPETMIKAHKGKTTVLKTPEERRKPMEKYSSVTTILRWVKATVITVSLGSVGAVHLQPNVLSPHNKHIKNRSTSLRWTSLALRLLCGRYNSRKALCYLNI